MAIRVETVASGETYHEDRQGLLEIVPGVYAPIRVCDLERLVNGANQQVETGPGGYHVLFHNQFITRTLADLERPIDVLGDASERYRLARGLLHTEHNGVFVPNLRISLLQGAVPDITLQNIFDDTISAEQYRFAADLIEELTLARRDTVYDWLHGNVVRPRDDAIVHALSQLSPFLAQFSQDIGSASDGMVEGNPNNLQDAYLVYKIVRSGVMSYLSRRPSESGQGEVGSGFSRRRLNLAGELSYIVDYLARDIDEEFSNVLVTKVCAVEGQAQEQARPSPGLGWGLVSPSEPPSGVQVLGGDDVERALRVESIGKLVQGVVEVVARKSHQAGIQGEYGAKDVFMSYETFGSLVVPLCETISGASIDRSGIVGFDDGTVKDWLDGLWRSWQQTLDSSKSELDRQVCKAMRAARNLYAVLPYEQRHILAGRLALWHFRFLKTDLDGELAQLSKVGSDIADYLSGHVNKRMSEFKGAKREGLRDANPSYFKKVRDIVKRDKEKAKMVVSSINKMKSAGWKVLQRLNTVGNSLTDNYGSLPGAKELDDALYDITIRWPSCRDETADVLGIRMLNAQARNIGVRKLALSDCRESADVLRYAVIKGYEFPAGLLADDDGWADRIAVLRTVTDLRKDIQKSS